MQEMLTHRPQSTMVIKGDEAVPNIDMFVPTPLDNNNKQLSVDSNISIGLIDELGNHSPIGGDGNLNQNSIEHDKLQLKYRQLKDKYQRLHKSYKATKSLRSTNEKILAENRILEKQLNDLNHKVYQQKDTIIRQNKHLLKLRSERDDFADVAEEQKEENKRLTQKYSKGPIIPGLITGNILNRQLSYKTEIDEDVGSHLRSATSPLVEPKSLKTRDGGMLAEDENFDEDSKFTMTYGHDTDAVTGDEADEEEQKYGVAEMATPTPGGPDEDALGPLRTARSETKRTTRFVEVDDITRDVERRYYTESRSVLTSQINPHKVKEQWEAIIGDVDDITIVEQSSEICDAWKINECECVERLLFILKYYSQWLNQKATDSKRKSRGRRDVLKQLPNIPDIDIQARKDGYTDSITEFISGGKLKHYNHVQLLNDFFHVKKFHIGDNNQHEHVFKHFVNEFGFCDVKHCMSFRRNHREKSFFGHHNRFRRKVYHLDRHKFKDINEYNELEDNSYELHEINTQQCLDMIHSTLIHDYHNTTTVNLNEFARILFISPIANDTQNIHIQVLQQDMVLQL